MSWDLTWSHWKHWLQSRIEVEATFVRDGKYRWRNGEWVLRACHTALPSRIRATVPDGLAADVNRAKAIHELLGKHVDVIERVRAEAEKQPVESRVVEEWFDRLGVSAHLKPQHATWQPDYEPYYFEQLRRRSATWFLFRNEYLFVWPHAVISEPPQPGHATYLYARPESLDAFLRGYVRASREDVRHNRNNIADELGFIGRVVRGRKRKRWLADVLKRAGEKADYVEALE